MPLDNIPREALTLPSNYVPPEKVEKRIALPPDFSTLNEGQNKALRFAIDYLEGKLPQYLSIAIEGFAGVGKTYLENLIIKWILTVLKQSVAGTAPTNKAVNVISDNADYHHPKLQYKTVHSLLGLKESYDEETGKLQFLPSFEDTPAIEEVDVLIVDESSMFPDDLFEMIYEHVRNNGLKLIFIGDSFQTPPVGKPDCIPFTAKGRLAHKIGVIRLDEIVRQAKSNPIINLSMAIREGFLNDYVEKEERENKSLTKIIDNSGIIQLSREEKEVNYQICDLYFNSPMFQMNPDFFKVIAWRNSVVDAVNTKVRSLIYKMDKVPKLMEGEKLIANAPIVEQSQFGPKVIYTNNQEFEVESFKLEEGRVYESGDIKLECRYYIVQTIDRRTDKKKEIEVVHEEDYKKVFDMYTKLAHQAKAAKDPQIRKWLWRSHFAIKKRFADIKYNYAITNHKAQGSTYDHAMVIMWDILSNVEWGTETPRREALRILYTSITRPKKFLFLVR